MYPPQINRPDYCSKCGTGYYKAYKCPNCGTETRKSGRKNNNGDKPRIDINFDGDDDT